MKPYGIDRTRERYPDLLDAKYYGFQASSVNLPGKGGDVRSNWKKPSKKAKARRYWKRRSRAEGKTLCTQII